MYLIVRKKNDKKYYNGTSGCNKEMNLYKDTKETSFNIFLPFIPIENINLYLDVRLLESLYKVYAYFINDDPYIVSLNNFYPVTLVFVFHIRWEIFWYT